ncbi:MAG: hypothetical protein LCH46_05110 [Proteobacteria bacterium]|nr:hypothetical protein [Pseudomonadota bacterium]
MSYGAHAIEMNVFFVQRKRVKPASAKRPPIKRSTRYMLVAMAAVLALATLAPITVLAA